MDAGKKIDLNTASVGELTQLPGVAKNVAYNIVNHRERHGLFTAWEELERVKEFPYPRINEIRVRAELRCPPGEECVEPRKIGRVLQQTKKPTQGYTKDRRNTHAGAQRGKRRSTVKTRRAA
jgi:competence ComEA-like helix-hairpin-helix protein